MIQQNATTTNTPTLLNQTNSETLIAQAPAGPGSWQVLPYNCPINPIHAALLRTGKPFFIAGSGNNPIDFYEPKGSALLDLDNGTFTRPTTPLNAAGDPLDLFCVGHSFRGSGSLMCNGGTLQYDPFFGLQATLLFDPVTEQWTQVAPMNSGRWYPTTLTLGTGQIFTLTGLDIYGGLDINPEIYSDSTGWIAFSRATSPFALYVHLFLMANGKIFYSGGQFGGNNGVTPRILTLPGSFSQPIQEQAVPGLQAIDFGNQAASVLLAPAQDQKVMIIGGGGNGVTNRVNIIDLKEANPTYVPAAPLNIGRMHHAAVLLPDRTVFVCNGSRAEENIGQSNNLPAEIYNPATNTWTVVATPNVAGRVYHAVALLLPDGRVITTGGNPDRGIVEPRMEIYSPAYMNQPRPTIQSAPQTARYGQRITIRTANPGNIKWVNLIRPMATTHTCDTEQRIVDAPITSRSGTTLTVTIPSNRNIAPVGWYMLFLTNNNDVPSTAKWIQLI